MRKLSDSNYISGAFSIQQAHKSAKIHAYIKNEALMEGNRYYDDHRYCTTNWLLNAMDPVNANRMKSCIMISGDEDLDAILMSSIFSMILTILT